MTTPAINAGELIHRVTFESRSMTSDVNGAAPTDWAEVATVWASIETLSGRELLTAQAINSDISHQITVRYRTFLADSVAAAGMRIRFRSRIFNVHQALNTGERNVETVLLASEGLNQG